MGTPEFAVASLQGLYEKGYDVCAVVTAPDRPAGRGRLIKQSPVKEYALSKDIPVLQPENLKSEEFIKELETYNANLFIVVAFRMLPKNVWEMPALGTFNLHASLLPQYRGAAPINWTIINGEKKGGLTTFYLRHEIDMGNIIFREEISIPDNQTAGEYHDRLKDLGIALIIRTVEAIKKGDVKTYTQDELMTEGEGLKKAPKLFKADCRIDWKNDSNKIINLIRGLSPYPTAFTEIKLANGKELSIKIFKAEVKHCQCNAEPGTIMTDFKTYFNICCKDACISVLDLQQGGKKRMLVRDFLRGLNAGTVI